MESLSLFDFLPEWEHEPPPPIQLNHSGSALQLVPVTLRLANDFVSRHHRHSGRTARDGGKWATGAAYQGELIGIAIVGRPVARLLADEFTAEVLRLCTNDNAPKGAASMLYGACWRAWKAMGGLKMVTYTLITEPGRSLHAAGWTKAAQCKGHSWNRPNRQREEKTIYKIDKIRWEVSCKGG